MMAMGKLVLGVRARAHECFEVRVGCTKRAEVAGGVGNPVHPSYSTSGKSVVHTTPRAVLVLYARRPWIYMDLGAQ